MTTKLSDAAKSSSKKRKNDGEDPEEELETLKDNEGKSTTPAKKLNKNKIKVMKTWSPSHVDIRTPDYQMPGKEEEEWFKTIVTIENLSSNGLFHVRQYVFKKMSNKQVDPRQFIRLEEKNDDDIKIALDIMHGISVSKKVLNVAVLRILHNLGYLYKASVWNAMKDNISATDFACIEQLFELNPDYASEVFQKLSTEHRGEIKKNAEVISSLPKPCLTMLISHIF